MNISCIIHLQTPPGVFTSISQNNDDVVAREKASGAGPELPVVVRYIDEPWDADSLYWGRHSGAAAHLGWSTLTDKQGPSLAPASVAEHN
ncbi:unnamed protein product [Lota lota]